MERISAKILSELLSGERELPVRPAAKKEQEVGADHWTRPVLLERAAYLRKLAKYGEGSASETIKEYPQHSAMLWFRSRDGDVEVDEACAYTFYILDGKATLVTGGMPGTSGQTGAGRIVGGTKVALGAGDIAHVAAGQPFQLLVDGDSGVTCLVFKVQESPQTPAP